MTLTFENDFDEIMKIARISANRFARLPGVRDVDDAFSDALVLAASISYDSSYPLEARRSYLIERIVGALLRRLQRDSWRTVKNPLRRVALDEEQVAKQTQPFAGTDARDALEYSKRGLSPRDRSIIERWLSGEKQISIAKSVGLSSSRTSQIVCAYRARVKRDAARLI